MSTPSETVVYTYTALGQQYQIVDTQNGVTTTTTDTYDASGNETSVGTTGGTAGEENRDAVSTTALRSTVKLSSS